MMNLKFIKIFSTLPLCVPALPLIFSTSCSSINKLYDPDGRNWIGYRAGYFSLNECIIDDDKETITYIHSSHYAAKNLVIPNSVVVLGKLYKVFLGESCFEENNFIEGSITFNENTTYIPKRCCFNTHYLQEIHFTAPIKTIDDYAFYGCGLLNDIASDAFVFEQLESIGDYAFYGTHLRLEMTFPSTLKKIGDYAFAYCKGIRKLDFSLCNNFEKIGNYQFINCDSLTTVLLPSSCWTIGDYAFAGCYKLLSISLMDSDMNLDIGEGAFLDDNIFTGFSKPFQFYKLGSRCFSGCKSFHITTNMFSNPNLTTIPDFAFSHSPTKMICFPPNIKSILRYAFYSNQSLSLIDFSNYPIDECPTISGMYVFSENSGSGVIYIPKLANFNLWKEALTDKGLIFDGKWSIVYPDN